MKDQQLQQLIQSKVLHGPRLYIHLILCCRLHSFTSLWATVCSSWVRMNAFTSCRSTLLPEGDEGKRYVEQANCMMSRSQSLFDEMHACFQCIAKWSFGNLKVLWSSMVSFLYCHPCQVRSTTMPSGSMRRIISAGAAGLFSNGRILSHAMVLHNDESGQAPNVSFVLWMWNVQRSFQYLPKIYTKPEFDCYIEIVHMGQVWNSAQWSKPYFLKPHPTLIYIPFRSDPPSLLRSSPSNGIWAIMAMPRRSHPKGGRTTANLPRWTRGLGNMNIVLGVVLQQSGKQYPRMESTTTLGRRHSKRHSP